MKTAPKGARFLVRCFFFYFTSAQNEQFRHNADGMLKDLKTIWVIHTKSTVFFSFDQEISLRHKGNQSK